MNEQKKYTSDEKIKRAHSSTGCMFIIITIISVIGINLYIINPEHHKIEFSLSLLWLSQTVTGILINKKLKTRNPYKFKYTNWENGGKLYYYLGVKIFRKILLHSPFIILSLGIRLYSGRNDLDRVLREIYIGEKSHFIALLVSIIIATVLYFLDLKMESLYLLIGLIFFHLYPIILQRWNRGRMIKLIEKMNKNMC